MAVYQALHRCVQQGLVRSCHDLADGGLAVAVTEACIGGRLGARIDVGEVWCEPPLYSPELVALLFSETPSRLLVEVAAAHADAFQEQLTGVPFACIGDVTPVERGIGFSHGSREVLHLDIDQAVAAWRDSGLGD